MWHRVKKKEKEGGSQFPSLLLHSMPACAQHAFARISPRMKEISSGLHLLWLWKSIPYSVPCTKTKRKIFWNYFPAPNHLVTEMQQNNMESYLWLIWQLTEILLWSNQFLAIIQLYILKIFSKAYSERESFSKQQGKMCANTFHTNLSAVSSSFVTNVQLQIEHDRTNHICLLKNKWKCALYLFSIGQRKLEFLHWNSCMI